MDNRGKYRKLTLIIMIVAVFISVCSLAWVVIFKGDDAYQKTNKDFYLETSSTKKMETTTEKSDGDEMFNVEITVPVTFILEDINYNSQLTDEQKEMGFKSVTYDGENSVTYLISKANHRKFLLSYKYDVTESIENSLKTLYPYIKDISYTDDLSHFSVKIDGATYKSADGEAIANTVSLPSMVYQLYSMTDLNCQVSFINANTNRTIETITP